MRQLLTILILTFISCGQTGINKELLTTNRWSIKKVENISTGQLAPNALNKGATWTFNKDYTATFEIKNDFRNQTTNGTWAITANTLTIKQESDTADLKIEQLTDTSLTWIMTDKDTLKFYLTAIKK